MGGLTTRQLKSREPRAKRRQGRSQLSPGSTLQNRYEVIGVAGVGGFSSVYKARDMRFANVTRLCAIKEMVITTLDPKLREMTIKSFEREANILATLEHPAIPDVFDYFTEEDRSYLVLEYIRGKDLEAVLAESETPLDQEKVLSWGIQVCDVLSYLHNRSPQPILFRDVKPSNVMLDVYDRIHLIDFNIAKVFHGDEKHTMVGTEGYSPPEQYRGESSPAADVYALGASFHHMLSKQDPRMEVPFSFNERSLPDVNPTVTPAFNAVVMRCLEYAAEDRYQNASELKEALELIAQPKVVAPETPMAVNGHAQGSSHAPVISSSGKIQPIWKFKCEDEVRASPLVADNLALVGAYDNNLYALNAESGTFAWKFPAEEGIAGRPEIYGNQILIGSADNHLYAISTNGGKQAWKYKANGSIYSSPRAKLDHAFFGADDGNFYAVNVNNGRASWKVNVTDPIRSSACIGDDLVYFGTEGGYVFCVDFTGQTKWQFQAKRAVTSTPYLYDDLIFVGSQDNTVYAIDANTGWSIWRYRTYRPIISSPVVHNNLLFIGSADGNLYALDIHSGQQKWSFKTEGQVASSPAIWNDAVYFGSTDGAVYSLGCKKGEVRWSFQTDGLVISSPAIVDSIVYIGSTDHHLYALPA